MLYYGLKSLAELDKTEEKEHEEEEVRQSKLVLLTTPKSSLDNLLLFFDFFIDLTLEQTLSGFAIDNPFQQLLGLDYRGGTL